MIKLKPAFKDYLWGGTKLKDVYKKQTNLDIVAESWELSAHPDGPSIVASGKYEGLNFIEYLNKIDKADLGSKASKYDAFPILIKFIDAKQALSIQVHPDDEYALRVEHEFGKNEMWYVMDCEPGSFLYYGVNRDLSKEEFKERIEHNTLLEVLNKVEVKPGDCFYIEAGTIHAIGAGILICEIQQNSNSTYRVYDFGRVGVDGKPRELHVDKAIDVSKLTPSGKNGEVEAVLSDTEDLMETRLVTTPYFVTTKFDIHTSLTQSVDETSFHSIIVLSGTGNITQHGETLNFVAGDSIFLSANSKEYTIQGECSCIQTRL